MTINAVSTLSTLPVVGLARHIVQFNTYCVTQYTIKVVIIAQSFILMNIEAAANLNIMMSSIPRETVTANNIYIFLLASYKSIYLATALARLFLLGVSVPQWTVMLTGCYNYVHCYYDIKNHPATVMP